MDENNNSNKPNDSFTESFTFTVEDTGSSQNQGPQQSKGKAIASMVLGIVGIVFACCVPYITFACAVVGLVLGIISLKKGEAGRGMALAGVIMCGLSLIGAVVGLILGAALLASMAGIPELESIMNGYGY